MIRPFTLLSFCAFAVAGAWLYQVKHAVAVKDRELGEVRRETEQSRQRLEILRAEWALLNEPDRLRQTATRVLTLEQMQPQHFVRLTEVDRRLPAAVAFAGAPSLFAAPPAPEQAPVPAPAAGVMLAGATVGAPAARVAQPAPAPAAALERSRPAPEIRAAEAPSPQALAATIATQRAEQAARPAPPPRPAAQPAPRPIQPAMHITPAPRPAEPPTRMTRATAPAPTVVSALGSASALGRPMLAPPVPIGSAAAATLHGQGAPVPVPVR